MIAANKLAAEAVLGILMEQLRNHSAILRKSLNYLLTLIL